MHYADAKYKKNASLQSLQDFNIRANTILIELTTQIAIPDVAI